MADNVHFVATVTCFEAFLGRSRTQIQKYAKNTYLESLKWEQYALNPALWLLKYNEVATVRAFWILKYCLVDTEGSKRKNVSNNNELDTPFMKISSPYCIKNVAIRAMPFQF